MKKDSIMVDVDVLESKLSMLTELQNSLNTVKQTMVTLTDHTYIYWEGSAQEVFKNGQKTLRKDIEELTDRVKRCKKNLSDVVSVYKRVERGNANVVDDLSIDNIF